MPRLITAILARNEAGLDRYLARILARCREFSDVVCLLDDRSTDDTPKIARQMGCEVRTRSALKERMWGEESPARKELWEFALEHVESERDWLLIADADMELHGDPRPLMGARDVNAWAWPLFDLWDSETTYRADQFWRGHEFPRVWMVRPRSQGAGFTPDFGSRGLHSGHIPANFVAIPGLAPPDVYWLHLGWMRPEHRRAKHQQYLSNSRHLTAWERAHAESILSES